MGTVGNISDTFHLQFKNGTAQFQGGYSQKFSITQWQCSVSDATSKCSQSDAICASPMAMLSFGRNLKMLPVRRNMRLLDGNAQFRMQPQNAPSRFSLQALGFFPGTDTMRPGCSSHTTSQQAISKRKPTTLRIPRRSPIQVLTQPKVA